MAAPGPPSAPDFITFLFSQKPRFDCYFIVGEKSLVTPERIGAVKMMLMAHSVVFRTELEESELKEKGDIAVKDIYPDTFRTLLKFIYGYDTTGELEFDEADNMFYAAEKYMMSDLKNKLALRLMALLTPDNLCCLLNNPACFTQLQLKAHITQIIRYETDKVLASPRFLEVCPEGFISILEQDGLAVPEIDLWRAALKWAKHRAGSEDGKVLREQISKVSKHLRVCTISGDQFCQEVVPAEVLRRDDETLICWSIVNKRKLDDLTEFSNEIEPRERLHKKVKLCRWGDASCSDREQCELKLNLYNKTDLHHSGPFTFTILTKQCAVELLPLVCLANKRERMEPEGWTYRFGCRVMISKRIERYAPDDSPLTIKFSDKVEYGKIFEVPLAVDGCNVTLLPNSNYTVVMSISSPNYLFSYSCDNTTYYENDHMVLRCESHFPSNRLYYRLANDE